MEKADLPRAFTWLESGPVILVSTREKGRDDIMTISWQMVVDFAPHIAISTGPWNESYQRILDTRECVVNVPGVDLIDPAIRIGTSSGSQVDKFSENGLTRLPAEKVRAPLVGECLAAIECRLEKVIDSCGILVLKGVQLWENPDRREKRLFHANGDGTFFADGELLNRRREMKKWIPAGCLRLDREEGEDPEGFWTGRGEG